MQRVATAGVGKCRFCGEAVGERALKCNSCKSLQRLSPLILLDTGFLLALVTPLSAFTAALTYIVSSLTPNYSTVSFAWATRNAGQQYFIARNSGNANAQLIRAKTEIHFSDTSMSEMKLISDDRFVTASPLDHDLQTRALPPGSTILKLAFQDYQPSKDGKQASNYHFDYLVELAGRQATKFAEAGNKPAVNAVLELVSYLVGQDDSRDNSITESSLDRYFQFSITLDFVNHDGRRDSHKHQLNSQYFAQWVGNYADIRSPKNSVCVDANALTKSLSEKGLVDLSRIYRGHCFGPQLRP